MANGCGLPAAAAHRLPESARSWYGRRRVQPLLDGTRSDSRFCCRAQRLRRPRYVLCARGDEGPAKRSSGRASLNSRGIVDRTNDGRNRYDASPSAKKPATPMTIFQGKRISSNQTKKAANHESPTRIQSSSTMRPIVNAARYALFCSAVHWFPNIEETLSV